MAGRSAEVMVTGASVAAMMDQTGRWGTAKQNGKYARV